LSSLVKEERIRTTLEKAKELRPLAEKAVTQGKRDTVHARRQVNRLISDRGLVKKLFDEIAPRYHERPGGYTRIIKLGPRKGDGAEMAFLEFVDRGETDSATDKKGKKGGKKAKSKSGD
jgi:large subunit ribosomal protein L17